MSRTGEVVNYKVYLCAVGYEPEIRCITIDKDISHNYFYLKQKLTSIFPSLKEAQFTISWKDSEGDRVRICTDEELIIALKEMVQEFKKIYVATSSHNENEGPIHPNVVCDGCEGPIQGFRYKCIVCVNFDLCPDCERSQLHPDHPMIRIPLPMSLEDSFCRRFFSRISKNLDHMYQASEKWERKARGDCKGEKRRSSKRPPGCCPSSGVASGDAPCPEPSPGDAGAGCCSDAGAGAGASSDASAPPSSGCPFTAAGAQVLAGDPVTQIFNLLSHFVGRPSGSRPSTAPQGPQGEGNGNPTSSTAEACARFEEEQKKNVQFLGQDLSSFLDPLGGSGGYRRRNQRSEPTGGETLKETEPPKPQTKSQEPKKEAEASQSLNQPQMPQSVLQPQLVPQPQAVPQPQSQSQVPQSWGQPQASEFWSRPQVAPQLVPQPDAAPQPQGQSQVPPQQPWSRSQVLQQPWGLSQGSEFWSRPQAPQPRSRSISPMVTDPPAPFLEPPASPQLVLPPQQAPQQPQQAPQQPDQAPQQPEQAPQQPNQQPQLPAYATKMLLGNMWKMFPWGSGGENGRDKEDSPVLDSSWAVIPDSDKGAGGDSRPADQPPQMYPAIPVMPITASGENILENTLAQLAAMGFQDQDGWLEALVSSKNGNLEEVLQFLAPIPKKKE